MRRIPKLGRCAQRVVGGTALSVPARRYRLPMIDAAPASSPLIASRQTRSGDDPIFALNSEANARKARGEDVINATLGALLDDQGRLAVLPTAARAVKEVPTTEWAAYAPIEGSAPFVDAVVQDLFGHDPELVACCAAVATPGGTGALRHAIANFLEPGQALLTTSFFWGPYKTLADENERGLATFDMFDAAGALDVAALDAALGELIAAQGRALVILNDPCHNPCGYSMSQEDWDGVERVISTHAARAPVTLVLDNAYSAFGPPDAMQIALRALVSLSSKALVLVAWSASKSFTHYGLRVGALVALVPDDDLRKKIQASLTYACRGTWSNCNRGGMAAIARLLTDEELRTAVDEERAGLIRLLDARVNKFNECALGAGLEYPRYRGGFFTSVYAKNAADSARTMRELGVYVVPIAGALRLGICALPEADIDRAVSTLAAAL